MQTQSSFIIILTVIQNIEAFAPTPHIDWCLYWRYLNKDQHRPECNGVYRLRFAKHKVYDHSARKPIVFSSIPTLRLPSIVPNSIFPMPNSVHIGGLFDECQASHFNCGFSHNCNSLQMCTDSRGYCCGPQRVVTTCPSPDTLATTCNSRRRHINWCSHDSECAPHLAPRQNAYYSENNFLDSLNQHPSLCCPTKCGYNVCVR